MVSFRFPFSFSQPPKPKPPNATSSNSSKRFFYSAIAASSVAVVGAGISAGIVVSQNSSKSFAENPLNFLLSSPWLNRNQFPPMWGSITLADSSVSVTDSRTGMSFPSILKDSQRLLGTGVRNKAILGLKNIDVYAFGVYADDNAVKKFLSDKHGKLSTSRGSIIDLSRDRGHVLRTTIDGKEVGSIQSKLLCRSILDLYIGDDPFDQKAKEDIEQNLISLLQK